MLVVVEGTCAIGAKEVHPLSWQRSTVYVWTEPLLAPQFTLICAGDRGAAAALTGAGRGAGFTVIDTSELETRTPSDAVSRRM